ncbi:MEDS domain-containing protein [Blastococcus sp. TML/M2B]|uniref:MEDS domain-containing protein n=1 Tax=Blastococcus sp. TML/M2B TaxID=2798727 RepID=UPI0019097D6D|nr:MEDS domain-containing protein [Blastococcus sp. TML/M2B]MBN1092964.1 MEDS domain-containing protein [Blastococcus sp. TML/M2B]
MSSAAPAPHAAAGFEHEALFYRDDDTFLAGVVPFVREGLDRGERVVVAGATRPAPAAAGGAGRRTPPPCGGWT